LKKDAEDFAAQEAAEHERAHLPAFLSSGLPEFLEAEQVADQEIRQEIEAYIHQPNAQTSPVGAVGSHCQPRTIRPVSSMAAR